MVHTYNGILLRVRNAFEAALRRWMNLEPIIQSEVSQKEEDKSHVLTHLYGIWKDGTDEPVCRTATEMQTQRTDSGPHSGKEGVGQMQSIESAHLVKDHGSASEPRATCPCQTSVS